MRFHRLLEELPRDITDLAAVGHGLIVHEHLTSAYGVTLSEADRATVHIRSVERLLEHILTADDRPLTVPREPAGRVAGNCRHFTLLFVSALRAQAPPASPSHSMARARCGFGGYFGSVFEDHWVAEYWDGDRWRLIDSQIDKVQEELFKIDLDLTDVPRDRFLVAGEAWARCRAGEVDPGTFGLSATSEFGYWWIAQNMMRDAAALSDVVVLPWDEWGAMPAPGEQIDQFGQDRIALFDSLAELTRLPEVPLPELAKLCEDDRLRVPAMVRNAVRAREEAVR